jgi:RNA polymerase sigma-70 factor (ECF subfamily)
VRSDEAVLAQVARGDQDALRVLYERHGPTMLRLIRRLTSDSGVAEEILQEAWLAVWRSASSFRADAPARAWLLGVARRQAHNRLRTRGPVLADVEEAANVPDPGPGVEDEVLARADRAALAAAVRTLPEHVREVLVLVLVEDLPYPEVAATLAIPVGTVKSRMSHARRRLALELASSVTEGGAGHDGGGGR